MKNLVNAFLVVAVSFLMGASLWYFLFWFLLGDSHMLYWSLPIKALYLLLSYITSGTIVEQISKNEED